MMLIPWTVMVYYTYSSD